MTEKIYLTKQGFEKVQQRYENYKKARHNIINGDNSIPEVLHSEELNPDFVDFQQDLNFVESKIAELEYIIKHYEPIKPKKGLVDVGAVVTVESNGKENEFTIVDAVEANPMSGFISKESPVGKALIGNKEGDKVSLASSNLTYKIKKINYLSS